MTPPKSQVLQLSKLQHALFCAIRQRDFSETLHTEITPCRHLASQQSLAIYAHAYQQRLSRSLRTLYPVCVRLLGEECFNGFAKYYIAEYSSKTASLDGYGEHFAEFLAAFPPAQTLIYLSDVARLEWACFKASYGPQAEKLDIAALSAVSEAQAQHIVFQVAANANVLHSIYPVHRIWEVNQSNYQGDQHLDIRQGAVYLFIWRSEQGLMLENLSADEYYLLRLLIQSLSLQVICQKAKREKGDFDVTGHLKRFAARGWLTGFKLLSREETA